MGKRSSIRVLLVVDGYFSLGAQDRDDRSFSISHLISALKSYSRPGEPKIFLDTAHREGDHDATIWGKFNFADSVSDLTYYDEIWMFGYDGPNQNDISNPDFTTALSEDELLALAEFMEFGGGILASGDHDSLGCYMCGRIPRVRTMRKWFATWDKSEYAQKYAPPNGILRNWPAIGPTRADTLQKDQKGQFNFTNQSDDIPQPLDLIPVAGKDHHILFDLSSTAVLKHFPDHFHEGEVLGFGGSSTAEPWVMDAWLEFKGEHFEEYRTTKSGNQEKPRIIAMGHVIGGHDTDVEKDKLCTSGFKPDDNETEAKEINTLCAYNGHEVGVGRVLTDSSFHHFADLNLIGDPCASEEKTLGLKHDFLNDMGTFYVNCVKWLAHKRAGYSDAKSLYSA